MLGNATLLIPNTLFVLDITLPSYFSEKHIEESFFSYTIDINYEYTVKLFTLRLVMVVIYKPGLI